MDICILQRSLDWHHPAANRDGFQAMMEASEKSDLFILPETFTTGFSNDVEELAEDMDGPSVEWMVDMAKAQKAAVCGSIIIRSEGGIYNRMIWARPDGDIEYSDKRHLFRMADEHLHYNAGQDRRVVEWMGWRILLLVCYDLRFPVWSRNRYAKGTYEYDLVIYVANWPSPRHSAWETLLRARAMENLSPAVGVNRIGTDGNGIKYLGGSTIIDHLGQHVTRLDDMEAAGRGVLDISAIREFRKRFPTGMDADEFSLSSDQ